MVQAQASGSKLDDRLLQDGPDSLRGYLLDYFGQPHENRCENCGNCLGGNRPRDLTREAQMILSCVVRARNQLGYCVGASILSQTLHELFGTRAGLGLDLLPTYGLMSAAAGRADSRNGSSCWEAGGYLGTDPFRRRRHHAAGGLVFPTARGRVASPARSRRGRKKAERIPNGRAPPPRSKALRLRHLARRAASRPHIVLSTQRSRVWRPSTPHHRAAGGSSASAMSKAERSATRFLNEDRTLRTDTWEECTMNIRRFAPRGRRRCCPRVRSCHPHHLRRGL